MTRWSTYRLYAPDHDGKGKNDHFREMLDKAEKRKFTPKYVLFDSWYGGLDNLKAIRRKGWHWVTDLKKNRLVATAPHQHVAASWILTMEPSSASGSGAMERSL
jgi:putative transposase